MLQMVKIVNVQIDIIYKAEYVKNAPLDALNALMQIIVAVVLMMT